MIQLIHNWLVLHTYGTIDRKDLFHQLQYKSTLDVLHEFKTTKIATKRLESAKLRALQPKGENSSQQLRGNNIP